MVFLLLLPLALAAQDNLYQYDTLDIGLEVQSGFELVATGSGARAEEVTVNVLLVPMESYRQEILDIDQ